MWCRIRQCLWCDPWDILVCYLFKKQKSISKCFQWMIIKQEMLLPIIIILLLLQTIYQEIALCINYLNHVQNQLPVRAPFASVVTSLCISINFKAEMAQYFGKIDPTDLLKMCKTMFFFFCLFCLFNQISATGNEFGARTSQFHQIGGIGPSSKTLDGHCCIHLSWEGHSPWKVVWVCLAVKSPFSCLSCCSLDPQL